MQHTNPRLAAHCGDASNRPTEAPLLGRPRTEMPDLAEAVAETDDNDSAFRSRDAKKKIKIYKIFHKASYLLHILFLYLILKNVILQKKVIFLKKHYLCYINNTQLKKDMYVISKLQFEHTRPD